MACACGGRDVVRYVDHAPVDDTDPIAHTAFYVLGCPQCHRATVFPVQNFTLVTTQAQLTLQRELAA
jgi:hypothetical protein